MLERQRVCSCWRGNKSHCKELVRIHQRHTSLPRGEMCPEMHAIMKNAKTAILGNHTVKTARFMLIRKIKDPQRKQRKLEDLC